MKIIDARTALWGSGLGWLVVGAYGLWEFIAETAGEGGDAPYLLFAAALFTAAALTVYLAWMQSSGSQRSVLRRVGLAAGLLGLLSSVVAWALPLWMTILGISFLAIAIAAPRGHRTGLAVLSSAQFIGMAALLVGLLAEVGRQDSYGDYPAAFGIGLVVTAVGSIIGIAQVGKDSGLAHDGSSILGNPELHGAA